MSTEEYERKGFPFGGFLVKLIVIVKGVIALTSQIFSNNIEKMFDILKQK